MLLTDAHREKGSVLIELIISILVLGVALLTMVFLFFTMGKGVVTAQLRSQANYHAQDLMEQILSRRFDENAMKTGSPLAWTVLGTNTGESSANMSTFDDVDDFDGWTDTPVTGYSRSVTVYYVSPSNLNTQVTINATQQDYKKITVTVSSGGVTYATLVSVKAATR